MAKVDFWWDQPDKSPPVNYGSYVAEVLRRRPAISLPTIAVVGSFLLFQSSALWKSIGRTGVIRTMAFSDLPDEDIGDRATALLRWTPYGGRAASAWHRRRIPDNIRVLNDALDSDKVNVEANFADAAGYGSFIDPTTSDGLAVAKSRINGRHDGRVFRTPFTPEEDPSTVYQRLIDNSLGDHVFDLRMPFVLGNPLFAYIKVRERSRRFENSNAHVSMVLPCEVLTDEEIGVCRRFCSGIGLDYGELDILRDGAGGRMYVIDVNDTPAGPPKGLSLGDRNMALRLIALGFRRHVFNLPC